MNDPINTQDFALVDEARFAEIFREDSQTRQQLKECTPLPWDTTPRHSEEV